MLVRSFMVAVGAALLAACATNGGGSSSADAGSTPAGAADGTAQADEPPFTRVTDPSGTAATADDTTAAPTALPATTTVAPGPSTTSNTTSTPSSTTSTTTTTMAVPEIPDQVGPLDLTADLVGLGRSVEGRPIVAERYGTPGGRRMLAIGVIHGNEDDGVAVIEELRERDIPLGVELWLVESMNPDGQAAQIRHNAHAVDLNRNFPYNWGPIGGPGDSQYAGPGPASEPETRAMVNFIEQLRPDVAIWYHQDLFVINPSSGREGAVRARYAELTGLPMGQITGGTYTGIAATWARQELAPQNGVAFIVELGPTLSPAEATVHADAILTISTEP